MCEQFESYLFPVIMMGLQLCHGVVAISLLLPERGCVRRVQPGHLCFTPQNIFTLICKPSRIQWLTEYMCYKLPGNI